MTTQKIVDNFSLVHDTMTYIANDCLLNIFNKHEIFPPAEAHFNIKMEGAIWGLDKMNIEHTDNEEIETITMLYKFLEEYKDVKHSFDEGEITNTDAGHATGHILEHLRVELEKKRNIMNRHLGETVDAFVLNTTNEQWEVITYQKDILIDMNHDIQALKEGTQHTFGNLLIRDSLKRHKNNHTKEEIVMNKEWEKLKKDLDTSLMEIQKLSSHKEKTTQDETSALSKNNIRFQLIGLLETVAKIDTAVFEEYKLNEAT